MVDAQTKMLETRLRESMSRFLNETLIKQSPAARLIEVIKCNRWTAFLCGGTVRNLLLEPAGCLPRDLDIIIENLDQNELKENLKGFNCRENKFGGLCVEIANWKIDIWTLASTWALRNNYVSYNNCFSDYTRTTFLNIEAVAVEMFVKKGQKRRIFSNGFFESINHQTLEINFEKNPDPEVNIARAIYMSMRYGFSFGPNLRSYIVEHATCINKDKLLAIYRNNYLMKALNRDYLNSIFEEIEQNRYYPSREAFKHCLL